MEVNIEPGDVERYVAEAVLKSAIGKKVAEAVDKSLASLGRGYDNPLEKAISAYVQKIVLNVVDEEYRDRIRAAVRVHITDAVVDDLVQKAWGAWLDKIT